MTVIQAKKNVRTVTHVSNTTSVPFGQIRIEFGAIREYCKRERRYNKNLEIGTLDYTYKKRKKKRKRPLCWGGKVRTAVHISNSTNIPFGEI